MQRGSKASPSSPATPDGPPSAKRVRLSNGTSAPGTPATPEALQSPLTMDGITLAGEHSGETKWVLSVQEPNTNTSAQGLHVAYAGFATIDAEDAESGEEEDLKPAKMVFGGGVKNKKAAKTEYTTTNDSEHDSSEESDSEESSYDSDDPAAELIRETKNSYAQERESRRLRKAAAKDPTIPKGPAKQPKQTLIHEDADLKGLTSLSGGRPGGGGGRGLANMECYSCGQKGHKKQDCPKVKGRAGMGAMSALGGRGLGGGGGSKRF